MITFEQFITEEQYHYDQIDKAKRLEILADMKRVYEAEPYNFTWIAPENVDFTAHTLLAERKIVCDNIDLLEGRDSFIITYTPRNIYNSDILISYPHIDWPRWDNSIQARPYKEVTNFDTSPLFVVTDTETDLKNVLFRFKSGTFRAMYFKTYNTYLQQTGSKTMKSINTLEYYKNQPHVKDKRWTADEESAFLRLKHAYLPKDQLTKRDYIRGAMMDL